MLFALFPILLANAQTADVPIVHVLTIGRTGLGGRRSLPTDAIQAKFNMNPKFEVKENEPELMLDGTMRKWTPLDAGSDGVFRNQDLQGGWAYAEVTSQKAQIMMLEASGHSMVYVNGCPRAGDPYSFGTLKLPVQLESGVNRFLFAAGRGTLKAKLTPIVKPISLNLADPTLPDFVIGRKQTNFAAVVVSNATPQFVRDLILVAEVSGVKHVSRLDAIPPIGIRKVGFQISIPAISKEGTAKCSLHLMRANTEIDAAEIELHIRRPEGTQKRTFVSEIDGSVQYFGIVPCADASNNSGALVLTCHGASVEAIGQADAYSSKSWATIVAPTNRRPYGFDWEDWGRMDAMEVLKIAKQTIPHDNQRVYLTGHSMGGHGTYQLGALYPGEFAAIGPSAAWASFDSYTGSRFVRDPSPAQAMMERACAPSRTELLIQNYADLGVYILHGDADDNVPVREARNMKSALDAFHKDVRLFEQPGAGHWWENSDEPGAECMDWPPMYDFFARHRKAAVNEVRHVLFLTACPGISAKKDWVEILTQEAPLKISKVDMSLDPKQRRFTGTTENVERLRLLLGGVQGDGEISIKIGFGA